MLFSRLWSNCAKAVQIHDQQPPKAPTIVKPEPIPVAVQVQLKPYDEIESLTVDTNDGKPFVRERQSAWQSFAKRIPIIWSTI